MRTVICDYCGRPAHYVDSAIVYNGRSYGMIWYCQDCRAWVGCHKGSDRPKGRLADAELRGWKRGAHAAFDPIWRGKTPFTRRAAYAWLAEEMGLPPEQTHIGMFNVDQCKQVIKICKERRNHEKVFQLPEEKPSESQQAQLQRAHRRGDRRDQ